MAAANPKQYEVLVGINYPPEQRAEPGDVRDDLPRESIAWLLEDGIIREYKPGKEN